MLLGSGLLPHLGIAGGGGLTGTTWAIDGSDRAYNTPTLGAELLTDGGFENWASATDLTNWIESSSGTSTVNREASIVNSGTYAVRFDVDPSGYVAVQQNAILSTGTWYQPHLMGRNSTGDRTIYFLLGSTVVSVNPLTQTYSPVNVTGRASGSNFYIYRANTATYSLYLDDASVKALSLPTLSAYTVGTANQTPLAKVYAITAHTQAGTIGWLDNPASPQNFIIAIRNGAGNVNLTKCVAGTYTNLISISSTFVQDAAIEIRRPSGNTFQLWYNGSQVGTDQTISDTAIADNSAPYYGVFSTYSGNTFSEFRLGGNLIPFGF